MFEPRQRRSRWPAIRALLLIIAALAAINWQIANMTIDIAPTELEADERPGAEWGQSVVPPAVPTVALSSYPETTARPLFNPYRRPPDKKVVVEPPKPEPLLDEPRGWRLVGIMQIESGGIRALLRSGAERGDWVAIGDQVNGWSVSEIREDGVTFVAGQQRFDLKLFPRETGAKAAE